MRTRYHVVALLIVIALPSYFSRVLDAQNALPTTAEHLALTPRPIWLAALAAACDTLPIDATWRRVSLPRSDATLPLPIAILESAHISDYHADDVIPSIPAKHVELYPYDPITARITRDAATVVIRCTPDRALSSRSRPRIWVMGYESRRLAEPPPRGTWYVLASWQHDELWLFGMSRDLAGARALVTGIGRLAVPADSAGYP